MLGLVLGLVVELVVGRAVGRRVRRRPSGASPAAEASGERAKRRSYGCSARVVAVDQLEPVRATMLSERDITDLAGLVELLSYRAGRLAGRYRRAGSAGMTSPPRRLPTLAAGTRYGSVGGLLLVWRANARRGSPGRDQRDEGSRDSEQAPWQRSSVTS